MSTKIEWCDETWNPVHGCTHAGSPGCDMCYARRMARRLQGRCGYPEAPDYFKVTLRPDRLEQPLKWRKPRRVFVVSMGDLFHDDVDDKFIDEIFGVMLMTSQHTYQLLTKRPARMLDYLTTDFRRRKIWEAMKDLYFRLPGDYGFPMSYGSVVWPLPNVWPGVTVENQDVADQRRADFEATPAAVKFVSYEPALGLIDWTGWEFVDQIISGGETGPRARPSPRNAHRSTRDFCQANDIAYFFKQHGEWLHFERRAKSSGGGYYHADNGKRLLVEKFIDKPHEVHGDFGIARVGNKAAGHLLDGREWREMPGGVK